MLEKAVSLVDRTCSGLGAKGTCEVAGSTEH